MAELEAEAVARGVTWPPAPLPYPPAPRGPWDSDELSHTVRLSPAGRQSEPAAAWVHVVPTTATLSVAPPPATTATATEQGELFTTATLEDREVVVWQR